MVVATVDGDTMVVFVRRRGSPCARLVDNRVLMVVLDDKW
jgi:hypothetical protein